MKAALHAVVAFGLCATPTAAFRASSDVERSEYLGASDNDDADGNGGNLLSEIVEIVEPWVELGGDLIKDEERRGFLSELVYNAKRGNAMEVIGSTLDLASKIIEAAGFPIVAFFLDLIVAIFFEGSGDSTWDEIKGKVRREIDDALLSYRLGGAGDQMEAVNQQLRTSPFYS